MALEDVVPVSLLPNQPWNGPNTDYIVRVGSETPVQAAARATAGSAVQDLIPGTIVTNPNAVPGSGYLKVFVFGNSITAHPGISPYFIVDGSHPVRGMAASVLANDFMHRLTTRFATLNAGVVVRGCYEFDAGSVLNIATGPYWESQSTTSTPMDNSFLDPVTAWTPDLIIWRVGENVTDSGVATVGQASYKGIISSTIDKIKLNNTGCPVILTTAVWDRPNYDAAILSLASDRGYRVADFRGNYAGRFTNGYYALRNGDGSKMFPQYADGVADGGNGGVNEHPNDYGMMHISDTIWSVLVS